MARATREHEDYATASLASSLVCRDGQQVSLDLKAYCYPDGVVYWELRLFLEDFLTKLGIATGWMVHSELKRMRALLLAPNIYPHIAVHDPQ